MPSPPPCCERACELIADGGGSLLSWCSNCGRLYLDARLIATPELIRGLPQVEETPEQQAATAAEWQVFREVLSEVRRRRIC